ncbi:MAG: family 43 glycosylhydrolase [Prolixibacteraceae bacterium]
MNVFKMFAKLKINSLLFIVLILANVHVVCAQSQQMMFGDSVRTGVPFSKDPYVIRFQHRFLMYYSVPAFKDQSGNSFGWGIGIAESNDLIHWKRIGEVNRDPRAIYESKGMCAPCLLVQGNKIHLFYQTYGNGKMDAICHAWSTDGLFFTRNQTNPIFRPDGSWNCGRAIDAEVIRFKGKYFLYYATRDAAYKIQMQGVAMAPGSTHFDRKDWTNLSKEGPMLKPELPWEQDCIEGASIINKKGQLYLFYAGAYNNAPQQIGVAKSNDGIHWERLFKEPFLPNGKAGDWNSSESGHPHIFANPAGEDYLFFQGNKTIGKDWIISNVKIGWRKGFPFLNTRNSELDDSQKLKN